MQGQPGIGKSSITKRLVIGLVGFGMRALIPGDIKGEYTPLITALGGTVWRLGRGHHALNPLDPGLAAPALAAAVGTEREQIAENLRTRTLALLEALLAITSGRALSATGRRLLATALDQTTATRIEPTIPDLLHALTVGADPLPQIVAADADRDYARAVRELVNTLGLLCDGSLRGLFDRPSTITADPTTPALSLDMSALDDDADDVVAAAMLCSWAWSATLADTAGDHRNTVQVQDELWRALRAAPGLVEHSDRITRLGRHRGIVSIQVTHSLDDLDALPTPTDRAKARGMAARNAILILGGMAPQDLDRLAGITALTDPERDLVASWAAPPTWHPGHIHPGRGRYLIKSGQRIGLPVGLRLTPTEARLYDTDTAFRTAAMTTARPAQRRRACRAGTRRRSTAAAPGRPRGRCCSPRAPSGSPPESPRSWAPAAGPPRHGAWLCSPACSPTASPPSSAPPRPPSASSPRWPCSPRRAIGVAALGWRRTAATSRPGHPVAAARA